MQGQLLVSCIRKADFQIRLLLIWHRHWAKWVFSLVSGSLRGEIQFSIRESAIPAHRKLGIAGCKYLHTLGRYLCMVLCRRVQALTTWQRMNSLKHLQQSRFEVGAALQSVEENIPNVLLCICLWASFLSEVSLPLHF